MTRLNRLLTAVNLAIHKASDMPSMSQPPKHATGARFSGANGHFGMFIAGDNMIATTMICRSSQTPDVAIGLMR